MILLRKIIMNRLRQFVMANRLFEAVIFCCIIALSTAQYVQKPGSLTIGTMLEDCVNVSVHNVYSVTGEQSSLPWDFRLYSKNGLCDSRMSEICDTLRRECMSSTADRCVCQIAYGECMAAAQCLSGYAKVEFDRTCESLQCNCGITGRRKCYKMHIYLTFL